MKWDTPQGASTGSPRDRTDEWEFSRFQPRDRQTEWDTPQRPSTGSPQDRTDEWEFSRFTPQQESQRGSSWDPPDEWEFSRFERPDGSDDLYDLYGSDGCLDDLDGSDDLYDLYGSDGCLNDPNGCHASSDSGNPEGDRPRHRTPQASERGVERERRVEMGRDGPEGREYVWEWFSTEQAGRGTGRDIERGADVKAPHVQNGSDVENVVDGQIPPSRAVERRSRGKARGCRGGRRRPMTRPIPRPARSC